MVGMLPRCALIVANSNRTGYAEGMSKAFMRLGVRTSVFYAGECNTLFDRYVIHTINHYAHVMRIVPKSVNLFQGHPKSHKEHRSRRLLTLCRELNPDLVIITRGISVKQEVLEEIQRMATVFCWFLEAEERLEEMSGEAEMYDHIYFFSSKGVEWARKRGMTNVSLLQHGVDGSRFYPMGLPRVYDWCFVGKWHARRQEYLGGLAEVSRNFVIYGPVWRRRAVGNLTLWMRVRGSGIWGERVNRLYNQTKVVINVSTWGGERGGGSGVNMRFLEVPASGTCLLTDFSSDAELLMSPGKDFVGAMDLSEMKAKLADLLSDDHKRNYIAQNGYEKARKARSYDNIVAEICGDWAGANG